MAEDTNFKPVVENLIEAEKEIAEGVTQSGQRPWMDLQDIAAIGNDDANGLNGILTRNDANNKYATLVADADTQVKDIQTLKLSADFLAGLERDMGLRKRSRIRLFVHAANRTRSNGTDSGPLRRNTLDWMSRIMEEDKDEAN
jgi:hypothetical protein